MEFVSNIYDLDCGYDIVRWIQFIEKKEKLVKKPSKDQILQYQEEIVQLNDSALAYFFACEFPVNKYKMQQIVLNNNDYLYSYLFAKNVKDADVKALEKLVLKSKNIKLICKFLCNIDLASKDLEDLVLRSKNYKYIYYYLKNGKNQDLNKVLDILIASKKPRYLYEVSKYIDDLFDLEKIESSLLESKNYNYIRMFAVNNKFANIERIEDFILENRYR